MWKTKQAWYFGGMSHQKNLGSIQECQNLVKLNFFSNKLYKKIKIISEVINWTLQAHKNTKHNQTSSEDFNDATFG